MHLTRPHQQTQPRRHATTVPRNQATRTGVSTQRGAQTGASAQHHPHQWRTRAPTEATRTGPGTHHQWERAARQHQRGRARAPTTIPRKQRTRAGRAPTTNGEQERTARRHERGRGRARAPTTIPCQRRTQAHNEATQRRASAHHQPPPTANAPHRATTIQDDHTTTGHAKTSWLWGHDNRDTRRERRDE